MKNTRKRERQDIAQSIITAVDMIVVEQLIKRHTNMQKHILQLPKNIISEVWQKNKENQRAASPSYHLIKVLTNRQRYT